MAKFVGTTQRVIIDRQVGDYWIGRTQYDSPEVDCEVLVENIGNWTLEIGDFYNVLITKAEEFDLYGEIQ
jgi:ribosomal protein S12 methylthiotransferase